ncbi:MAG: BCCT family transporter, partial [Aeromonas sobria]
LFLVLGPTIYILNSYVQNIGDYLQNIVKLSFWTNSEANGTSAWQSSWTAFYWGWWIAWAPFVGMFIARISKGRTIREFVLGVLLVPSLLGMFWLTVFGGTAMNLELFGGGGVVAAVNQDVTLALYQTVELLHWGTLGWIAKGVLTLLICTYFITSSDSGTLVITTLLSIGDQDPPVLHRAIWGLGQGLVAAILLLSGGLAALQAASIIAALPFSVIMLAMCYSLMLGLKQESQRQFEYRQNLKRHDGSSHMSLLDRIGPA